MVVNIKVKPYLFDINGGAQHHFGRCYISDFEKTFKILNILKEYGVLRLDDFPLVFPTSRAENWREHLIEMWRTGLNIGIVPYGAGEYGFAYLGQESVKDIEAIKSQVIKKRESYPYTLFFLNTLKEFPDGIIERELAEKFFTKNRGGKIKDGSIDQIHPTMDDLTRWGYIEGKQNRTITDKGLKLINLHGKDSLNFICYSLDLGSDNYKARILWAILRTIEGGTKIPRYPLIISNPPYKIKIKDIINKFNSSGLGNNREPLGDPKVIIDLLKELKIDHRFNPDTNFIHINEKIFFSITPQGYIKSGLSFMDKIEKHTAIAYKKVIINEKKLKEVYWVVTDEKNQTEENFPKNSSIVNFKEWLKLKDELAKLHPKVIILPPSWSPAILEASCGHIHSFVKNGGTIIIHGPQGGRTGTNKQFYNWLPEDFERLNFLDGSNKWTFDNKRLSAVPISPIYCDSFLPPNIGTNPNQHFVAKYGKGLFIFEGRLPSKEIYKEIEKKYCLENKEIPNFKDTPSWKWRRIAQLYRDENILVEENIYPIVGDEFLHKHMGFKLSESFACSWLGGGSIVPYVDLYTIYPCITLWEIDSIKGKSGILKGLAGDSIAMDITHAEKTAGYCKRAEKQYFTLLNIIKRIEIEDLEKFKFRVLEDITKLETFENFQMKEIFEKYLEAFLYNYEKFNSKQFSNFIENCNRPIGNKPAVCLLGTSYGFPEGPKMSAREISKRDEYSLWTYRDLYEFLVKTEKLEIEDRLKKLLVILNFRSGPVYFEIAKL